MNEESLHNAAASMGRKGGKKKVPKGLSMLTSERRKEISALGVEKRRQNKLFKK